ncbi:MAG: hypothetical protein L0228_00880 [Planctomycetes bacterium]|nr:hypothetical protein [Planctomycetota bacterium]
MPPLNLHATVGQYACLVVLAWTDLFVGELVAAEPVATRAFNGPDTVWQVADEDRVGRVFAHEIVPGGARDNAGMERLVIAAPGGESVHLVCPSAEIAAIDELEIRIWVKASRPDIQLAARARLPRTIDPDSKSIASAIVRGAKYDRPGHWQQLVLNDVPKMLAAEVRVLRSTPGRRVDPREAFVDAVVLIVPGESQGVAIETDDLVIDGVVRNASEDIQLTNYPAPATVQAGARVNASVPATLRRLPDLASSTAADKGSVRLQGELLLIDDRPFVSRAIQWQGEPLQFLSERGFNVVLLDRPPSAEQSADAKRHGLWFIARPPQPETLARDGLGTPGDRVIAWYLEDNAIERDPNYPRRWTELVRERDTVADRPVIVAPHDHWSSSSKIADVLLAQRSQMGFLSSADYDRWLESRSLQIRPGTPIWACFATQFDPAVGRQISALGGVAVAAPSINTRQLQSLVRTASMRGVRGFVFHSDSPLNEPDVATRLRTSGLELINRRLQRLEPWLAAGHVIGRFPSADHAWSAVVLHVDHARLLIPIADPAADSSTTKEVAFVVPGVPESCQVFSLSPVALKTLPIQRVAGGTRFVLRPDDDTFVLMTEDPKVVQSLRQLIARDGVKIVRAERDRAALQAAAVAEMARGLAQLGVNTSAATQAAASANGQLQQVNAALTINRTEQAHQVVIAANQALEQARDELRRGVTLPSQLVSNPLALSHERLVEFAAFERTQTALRRGENLLYGGDFEDLGQLTPLGWRHFRESNSGVESNAELSATEPRHGSYCLALHAAAATGDAQPHVEGTPVWIESPPVAVTAGQLVEIGGWVRVEASPDSSGDGLQIVDSLGGPDLALVVRQTNGWERFTIIRAAPESTEMRLAFALTGLGSARLDAVMVLPLEQAPAQRLPILAPAGNAPPATPSAAAGPLFVAPQTR